MAKNNPIIFKDLADLKPGAEEAEKLIKELDVEFNTFFKTLGKIGQRLTQETEKSISNINTLKDTVSGLNATVAKDQAGIKASAKAISEEEKAITDLRKAQKGLELSQKTLSESSSTYRQELKRLRGELEQAFNNKDTAGVKKLALEIKDLKDNTEQLSRATRGANSVYTAAAGSLKGMELQLSKLKTDLASMDSAFDPLTGALIETNQEAVKLDKKINELDKTVKNARQSIGENFRNVGNYAESIIEAKNALDKQKTSLEQQVAALKAQQRATGKSASEQKQLREELQKTNRSLEEVNQELKGFGEGSGSAIDGITGKLGDLFTKGGLIAAGVLILDQLAGAFAALQEEIVQTNKELRITESITGLTGGKLDSLTSKIKASAKTFDKDFNEILQAGNALMKTFNISSDEAFETINAGLASGLDLNGDFLDQLKEYSVQFKAAGLNAQDLYNILEQSTEQGIYSDKGADTIKEAGLSLREFTKATRDALKPLGKEFNDQIQNAISSGDTFKAIQLVSRGLSEVNLTAAETQTIIADVFKGAGEDAGLDFIKTLAGIKTGQDAANRSFTEAEKKLLDLNEANEEYASSLVELSANFKTVGNDLSRLWTGISTVGVDALNAIVGLFVTAEGKAKNFVDTLNTFTDNDLNKELKEVNKEIEKTVRIIEATKKAARSSGQLGLTSTNQIGLEQEYQGLLIKREGIEKQLSSNLEEYRNAFIKHTEALEKEEEAKKDADDATKDLTDSQKDLVSLYSRAIDKSLDLTKANYNLAKSYFAIQQAQAKDKLLKDDPLSNKGADDGKENKSAFLLSVDERLEEIERIESLEKLAKESLARVEKAKKDSEKARTETAKEEQERRNEIIIAGLDVASEAVNSIFELSTNKYERETEALQIQKSKEVQILEQSAAYEVMTNEQKEKTKEQIDQIYARKELQLRQKQAKRERAMALFNIAISTASAIVRQLAATPLPLGAPFVAAIGAIGAIKLATVAAEPLPTFFKGTDNAPEGPAWVGEKGWEFVERRGRLFQTNDGPQLMPMQKGDKVYTHNESLKMLSDAEKSISMSMPLQSINVHKEGYNTIIREKQESLTVEKVSRLIIEAREKDTNRIIHTLKNLPVPSLAAQGGKLFDVIKKKNSQKTILDKYYS